jgi:sigma-B regulation protein RsbU (phosphoserine phosphatase)
MSTPAPVPPPVPPPSPVALDPVILQALMETIPDTIYFKDRESRFVRVNRAQAHLLGLADPAEAVGRTDADFFSAEHAAIARAEEEEIMRTGRPLLAKEEKITLRDGREAWVSSSKLPWRDASGAVVGTFGLSRDITAHKLAEEKLADERALLHTIVDLIPSRIFVKDRDGRYLLNNRAHLASLGVVDAAAARGRTTLDFHPGLRGQQAVADDRTVLETGAPLLDQEKSDFGPEAQTRWSLTTKVPLRDARGRIAGLVGISHDITERKRAEAERQSRADEMEADLRMARQILEALQPRTPPTFPRGTSLAESALRFAHRYQPAASLGGDFFDYIAVSDTEAGVVVGDVMGHGVRAALIGALLHGLIEELRSTASDPGRLLRVLNRDLAPILREARLPVFATMLYAVIDLGNGQIRWANAGHPPPLRLNRADDRVNRLVTADPEPALGFVDRFNYMTHTAPFGPHDGLLLYTDGLSEAGPGDGRQLGETGVMECLRRHAEAPAESLAARLLEAARQFGGRDTFEDDICLVVAEATGQLRAAPPDYSI